MTYSSDSSSGVVERFEGEWFEGKMQGKVRNYFVSTFTNCSLNLLVYLNSCYFKLLRFSFPVFSICAQGVYYYSDGSVYDGVWVAGKMQGKGSFLYPNGNKYDGDFFVSSHGL